MYWNSSPFGEKACASADELQHKMYWNSSPFGEKACASADELQHKMYWNLGYKDMLATIRTMNFNIRCIETGIFHGILSDGLIDELQHKMYWNITKLKDLSWPIVDELQHKMYWNKIMHII